MAPSIDDIRNAQRADGPAAILAIGTANPSNVIYQGSYPELYFGVTKSEHMSDLKNMFKRMCHGTTIKKRYVHITEELLKENPELYKLDVPSLDIRQEIMLKEIPILGKEASLKAMEEWSRPKSSITHVIFCTSSCIDMPGADYQLTKSLGLDPSVCRYMLYQQGCHAGGTVLRLAKDLENNRGARVLAVCCEMTVLGFHGPTPIHLDSMIGQALFADGASAVIVGADPIESIERPVFHLVSASQTILAESEGRIKGQLREVGLVIHLHKDIPNLISNNINNALNAVFTPLGIDDWNSIFWVAHPGGPAILDQVEAKAGLKKEKLSTTRHVLKEYGNMSSASVMFILDETRKRSVQDGKSTTGEGLDWGVLFGFGPRLTIETVVLHSVPLN